MPRPSPEPIGWLLARTSKAVSRAFDASLAAVGGSRPMWLILLALRRQRWKTQTQLARSLEISGPTLTHHLDALEEASLVTRARDPDNRRVQVVELTDDGIAMFDHLRDAAARHDARLRRGVDPADLERVRAVLQQFRDNVTDAAE